MLIQVPQPANTPEHPRLDYVLGELERSFRVKRRVHAADPDSRRNIFVAMCRVCPWQRHDATNSSRAVDQAAAHEKDAHGNLDGGLVRVECR